MKNTLDDLLNTLEQTAVNNRTEISNVSLFCQAWRDEAKANEEVIEIVVKWKQGNCKDQFEGGYHWIDHVLIDDQYLFDVFCRKTDCRCFIKDIEEDREIEFNGCRAEANRIISRMVSK